MPLLSVRAPLLRRLINDHPGISEDDLAVQFGQDQGTRNRILRWLNNMENRINSPVRVEEIGGKRLYYPTRYMQAAINEDNRPSRTKRKDRPRQQPVEFDYSEAEARINQVAAEGRLELPVSENREPAPARLHELALQFVYDANFEGFNGPRDVIKAFEAYCKENW